MTKIIFFILLSTQLNAQLNTQLSTQLKPQLKKQTSEKTTDRVCEDLQRLTCAVGQYDDGTGSAQNPILEQDQFSKIFENLKTSMKQNFKGAIKKPDATYFRKIVLSATGLSLNPICESAVETPTSACISLMVEGATDISIKDLLGDYIKSKKYGLLKDKIYFIESETNEKIKNDMLAKVKKDLGVETLEKKIESKIFPQIKSILIKKVNTTVSDPKIRKNLSDKINNIKFNGSTCSKNSTASYLNDLTSENAYYDHDKNKFNYCAGISIQNKSEFQIAFTIAHELAHSIDPCGITLGPQDFAFKFDSQIKIKEAQSQFPFPVLDCLRSEKSSQAEYELKLKPFTVADSTDKFDEIFESFCTITDQINEAFSDWMASEILPEYIQKNFPNLTQNQIRFGYSNVWRGGRGCDIFNEKSKSFDVHPDQEIRVNNIILVQPKIRKQMGCPTELDNRIYCSSDTGAILQQNSEPATQKNETQKEENKRSGVKK